MSIEAMAMVLHHSRMKGSAKLLLLGIANHEGDGGAFPSVATLAKYTGTTPRYVNKLMVELQEAGELDIDPLAGPNFTNIYRVKVTCPEDCDRSFNHRGGEPQFRGGMNHSSGGGVNYSSAKPSLEPSFKPERLGRRLDEGWEPSSELLEWAAKEFPDVDVKMQTEAFVDYWVSKSAHAMKKDWDRTWKNWIRNAHLRWGRRRSSSAAEHNMAIVRQFQKGELSG